MPNSSAVILITFLWLTIACVLPLYQLREARAEAHQKLERILAAEKLEKASVITAFDRSNQNLDAAAIGPCVILASSSILLVNQLLKLKRRYHELSLERLALDARLAALSNTAEN